MSSKIDHLVLLSSDQRPKYIEDIYSVMALPEGASFQFRYETKYLPPEILEAVGDTNRSPFNAVIAFKGNFNTEHKDVIVPVRWVQVYNIRRVSDFVVFYFQVQGFPIFNSQCRDYQLNTVNNCTEGYFKQISKGFRELPVQTARLGYIETTQTSDTDAWLSIVKLLSSHPNFDGVHFVKIGKFPNNGRAELRDNVSRMVLTENSYTKINIEFYAERFNGNEVLELSADEAIIRLANGKHHMLRSRYDAISSLLHVKQVEGRTESEIHFDISDSDTDRKFGFSIPVSIQSSPYKLLVRMIIPTVGAMMVALQGFLDPSVDIKIKAATVIVGALLIGFGTARK